MNNIELKIELVLSKLDTTLAKIDNLTNRIQAIESVAKTAAKILKEDMSQPKGLTREELIDKVIQASVSNSQFLAKFTPDKTSLHINTKLPLDVRKVNAFLGEDILEDGEKDRDKHLNAAIRIMEEAIEAGQLDKNDRALSVLKTVRDQIG